MKGRKKITKPNLTEKQIIFVSPKEIDSTCNIIMESWK